MVDVGGKDVTARRAVARAVVRMSPATAAAVRDGDAPKGDVLGPARIAGIQAAKRTWELIPLCHQLPLSFVDVAAEVDTGAGCLFIVENYEGDVMNFDMAAEMADGVLQVVTNDDVDFRLNGARVNLQAGTCWYLRLSDPHSVANSGPADRVHMVIDATVNGWIEQLFEKATAAAAA